MSEILPCPFCGTERVAYSVEHQNEYVSYRDVGTISCTGCGASITRFGDTSKPGYADNSHVREDCVEAWNTRDNNE